MVMRKPLVSMNGLTQELPAADGVWDNWEYSKNRDPAVILTKTLTARRTYLTGASGATMTITLPAGSLALDCMIYTVMSVNVRLLTTWVSAGATFVNGPATMGAGVPYSFQYDHASTTWYAC